jgi:hypothetical protein
MSEKFKNYFVLNAPVPIQIGQRVKLTKEQIKNRLHVTKKIKDDIFEAIIPFQFKAGEIFGFSGQVNKKLVNQMIDPEEIEPKPVPEKLEEDFDALSFLNDMSSRQLQYYARVKCKDMKLQLKMDIKDMRQAIRNFYGENKG